MKIKTEKAFDNISQDLIKNAKIELETDTIIEKENLYDKNTGKPITDVSYKFFKDNHGDNLSVYKQQKHSGYKLIVLYKGVGMVGTADFMTGTGKEMEKELPVAQDWPVYQLYELKRKMLCNLFDDPWDNRRNNEFKPSAEKVWELLEKCIAA